MPVDALAQDGHEVVVTQRSGIIDILQIAEGVESQETNPARAANLVFTKLEGKISKNFNGWLRFSITNGDLRDSVFVVQDRADNNLIFQLYEKSGSGSWCRVSNNGHIRFPVHVFGRAVIVPKGTTGQYLLRFRRNSYESLTFLGIIPFHLQYDGGKNHILVFLAIALATIAVYHFSIYLLSKVRMYLIHGLYSSFMAVFVVTANPWLYYWVSGFVSIKYLFDINLISSVLAAGAYGQFVYEFFDAESSYPKLRKWNFGFLALTVACIVFITYIQARYNAYFISRDTTVGFCFLSFVAITVFLFVTFRRQVKADYFLVVGSIALWGSILFGIYILYTSYYTDIFFIIGIGSTIEILIFALGIGYKLQQETRARMLQQARINEDLEVKVAQRTLQIQEQNEEIATQNEELISQSEELITQRDQLANQNKVIETQNVQLADYAKKLESTVAERTREIERKAKQITEFAFITAHNLRGPLARMKGLSDLIQRKLVAPEELDIMLNSLVINLDEMDGVIHNMQETLELQQMEISDWSKLQLKTKFEEIVNRMPVSEIGNISVNIPSDLFLYTSPEYLERIVVELIGNAVKFANPGVIPKIKVTAKYANGKTTIRIEDNGLGIDMHHCKDKLFKMYQRFHLDVSGKGTGLYMVRTLVTKLGGDISVNSTPLKGTTFELVFE